MSHGIIFYIDQPTPSILDFGGFAISWINGYFLELNHKLVQNLKFWN